MWAVEGSSFPGEFDTAPPKRRAHSCLPCRESKSRCDGGIPCSSCEKKRSKPACVYRDTLEGSQIKSPKEEGPWPPISGHAESRQNWITIHPAFSGGFSLRSLASHLDSPRHPHPDHTAIGSVLREIDVWKPFSNPVCVWDTCEAQEHGQELTIAGQALGSPFPALIPDALSLTLRNIYASYLVAERWFYLGETIQAWTALASIVHRAELIGLDQDSAADVYEVGLHTSEQRRHIWWLLVHFDTQLSLILGRRPLIAPHQRVARPTFGSLLLPERRLGQCVLEFTETMLSVLSDLPSGPLGPEGLSRAQSQIVEGHLSRLQQIRARCPELPTDGRHNLRLSMGIAAHQIELELVSAVLNCRMSLLVASQPPPQHESSQEPTPSSEKQADCHVSSRSAQSFCDDATASVARIAAAFVHISHWCPATSEPSWPRCYALLSTVASLAVSQIRHELQLHEERVRTGNVLDVFGRLYAAQLPHTAGEDTSSPVTAPPMGWEAQHRLNTGSNDGSVSPDLQHLSTSLSTTQMPHTTAGTVLAPCPSSPVGQRLQKRKKRRHAPSTGDQRVVKRARCMEPPILASDILEAEIPGARSALGMETAGSEHAARAKPELMDDQRHLSDQTVTAPQDVPSYLPISGPSTEVNWFKPAESGYFSEELSPEYQRSYSASRIPMGFHPPVAEVAAWQSHHYPDHLGIVYQDCAITFPQVNGPVATPSEQVQSQSQWLPHYGVGAHMSTRERCVPGVKAASTYSLMEVRTTTHRNNVFRPQSLDRRHSAAEVEKPSTSEWVMTAPSLHESTKQRGLFQTLLHR